MDYAGIRTLLVRYLRVTMRLPLETAITLSMTLIEDANRRRQISAGLHRLQVMHVLQKLATAPNTDIERLNGVLNKLVTTQHEYTDFEHGFIVWLEQQSVEQCNEIRLITANDFVLRSWPETQTESEQ